MPFRKLSFKNAEGQVLGACLDLPAVGQPIASALFAHCFTCTKNLKAIGHISRALTDEGIAVLRFDFTGLGESEGDFADTNFSSNVSDLVAAADFLKAEFEGPKILIGHSLGGPAGCGENFRFQSGGNDRRACRPRACYPSSGKWKGKD